MTNNSPQTSSQNKEFEDVTLASEDDGKIAAHKLILQSSSIVFKKPIFQKEKRKLPEKKVKCNKCGRMLLNTTGLNIHMKRMHSIDMKNSNTPMTLSTSNSVKSTTSVESIKSPPPKKTQDTINKIKPEEVPLTEDTEYIEVDERKNIEEDLKARNETTDLKIIFEKLRSIIKTQSENHTKTVSKLESEKINITNTSQNEYNYLLTENTKLKKENDLMKNREEVLRTFEEVKTTNDQTDEENKNLKERIAAQNKRMLKIEMEKTKLGNKKDIFKVEAEKAVKRTYELSQYIGQLVEEIEKKNRINPTP